MFTTKASIREKLIQSSLLKGTDESTITWLLDQPGCGVKHYNEDAIVAFRGDRYESLKIILRGSLAAEFQDFRGKVLKIESIRESETVASAILFAGENLLPVTLTAEKECFLFEIPKPVVFMLMQKSRNFLENVVTDMGNKLSILADKIYSLQFSTIKQKISAYLLDLANKQGTESPVLKVTKEVLAEIFGVTRPALSRCFSSMVKEGYFEQEGKVVHINSISDLEEAVEEE